MTFDEEISALAMLGNAIDRVKALAQEAQRKGENLQQVPELKLVGNAYVGMSERILKALEEPEPVVGQVAELGGAVGRYASKECRQRHHFTCVDPKCQCRHHGRVVGDVSS
jgi:hypothetical protein